MNIFDIGKVHPKYNWQSIKNVMPRRGRMKKKWDRFKTFLFIFIFILKGKKDEHVSYCTFIIIFEKLKGSQVSSKNLSKY